MAKINPPKRVVWIALFRGMGDAVLFYPALKRCMEIFPSAEIHLAVTRPGVAEVFSLYGFPGKVWVKPNHWWMIPFWVLKMGMHRFSMAIDASSIEQMHFSRWLGWFLLAPIRVGFHYGSSSRLYTHKLNTTPIAELPQKDMYLRLLEPFTRNLSTDLLPPPHDMLERFPAPALPKNGKRQILIHPGARDPYRNFVKCWPVEHYVDTISRLARSGENLIVIIGTDKERRMLSRYQLDLQQANIVNLCGKTTIPDHFHLIRNASLFVGNNSGAMHIAAAYRIPLITFAGGVPMLRWGPPPAPQNIVLGLDKRCPDCPEWNCDQDGEPCLKAITVDEVLQRAEKLLNSSNSAPVERKTRE